MDETYGTYVDDECFDIHNYDDTDHDTDDDTEDDTDDDIVEFCPTLQMTGEPL